MRAVARLSHPNIVTAFHAIEHEGDQVLVMEYVPGTDLATRTKEKGPASLIEGIEWVLQAARGLQHAHEAGIVHRDIKPGNLLLHENGTVKILDLGLARTDLIDPDRSSLTMSGVIMGTVDFIAPEQASEARDADHRADIYSLGCTLYFLLTGKPPFAGETLYKKIEAHVHSTPPSLTGTQAGVPQQLDRVFHRMLAKAPDDRYQSMAAVITSLEKILKVLVPVSPKKSRLLAPVAAAVLLIAGVAGWYVLRDSKVATVNALGLPLKPPAETGTGYFVDSGQRLSEDRSLGAKLGDLDGDGDLDAIVANYKSGLEQVWLNDGLGRFSKGASLGSGASTTAVDLGDLDGDGDLDAVFAERNSVCRVMLNDGNAEFSQMATIPTEGMSRGVTLADLNGDGILDAIISSGGVGVRSPNSVWFGTGTGEFTDSGQRLGEDASWMAALADLDGDGDLDAVFAAGDNRGDFQKAPNTIWLNDGKGQFEPGAEPFNPAMTRGLALGDLDGDGDLDAVVGNDSGDPSGVWINDGNLGFTSREPSFGSQSSTPFLADFDLDGDLDVVLPCGGGEQPGMVRWLNDGKGNFSSPLYFGNTAGLYSSGDIGDLDGDGDWDLFLPREGANEVWFQETEPESE